jgi:hypothetical protein
MSEFQAPVVPEDDDSFQFEDDKFADENKNIIYNGLLSGLYYLPPEHILKTQSGWGWPIRYKQIRELPLAWKPLEYQLNGKPLGAICDSVIGKTDSFCQFVQYAEVKYHMSETESGAFRIYRATVSKERQAVWSRHFERNAVDAAKNEANNIDVSNAGGFHSKQTLFQLAAEAGDKISLDFCSSIDAAIHMIEIHDHLRARECERERQYHQHAQPESTLRSFEAPEKAEAWLNLSRHGSWNRLHTHEGAVWSGCYYVKVPGETDMSRAYSGHLIMKPTPHRKERKLELSKVELSRLNLTKNSECRGDGDVTEVGASRFDKDCVEYLSIPPVAGTIIFFPSYVHHAVVPLAVREQSRNQPEGDRISLAFNYNEAKN